MSAIIQIPGGTFAPDPHEYRDEQNVLVPSVTQIGDIHGFFDFANVPGDTLEQKRKIGDVVHFISHAWDTGKEVDSIPQECGDYLVAWEDAKDGLGIQVLESEVSGIHSIRGMKYAFTRDRVVKLRGFPFRFVLELKCTYKEEPFWKYQLAGYELSTTRVRPDEHIGRIAIQLKPDGGFKPYLYENPRDKDEFEVLLAAAHIKIKEKLWKRSTEL